MIAQVSVPAATAILGYDLMVDSKYKAAAFPRRIAAAGLAGSAAALDSEIAIFIGTQEVGRLFNAATGPNTRDTMFRLGEPVPANADIRAEVVDAPVTSPLNLSLDIVRA